MRKQIILTTLLLLAITTLALSVPTVLAASNPNIPLNQGTTKPSNELPEASKVPAPPATDVDFFLWLFEVPGYEPDGYGNFVEGCRAHGGDVWVALYGPSEDPVLGGPCCRGPVTGSTHNSEPVYFANQCCNPPDFFDPYVPEPLPALPGNHCLCFVMRGLL